MPRKRPPFVAEKYPLAAGTTWLIGRYEFPYTVRGADGNPMKIDVLMALELPHDKLLAAEALDPSNAAEAAEAIRDLVRKPGEGKARRPERIVVATQRMAEEITAALGEIAPIEIRDVDELDAVFEQLAVSTAPEPDPSYLDGDATPEQIGRLFEVMAKFFEATPWKAIDDSRAMRVDVPALDVRGACISIMGAAGASFGFLLFDSIESYDAFLVSSEAAERGESIPLETDFFSVSFEDAENMHPALLKEIETHGWRVAAPNAYPTILSLRGGTTRMPAGAREVRTAVAGLEAFLGALQNSPQHFREEDQELLVVKLEWGSEGEVTITFPWASDEELAEWEDPTTVH